MMAYFIDGKDCMISEWILLSLAFTFVAMRIYTRLWHLRERLDWSDVLLIASALDALGLIICDTLTFQMGVMDDYAPSEQLFKASLGLSVIWPGYSSLSNFVTYTSSSQISFASNYFYDFGLGLPKFSMLAFYWIILGRNGQRALHKTLWGITVFVVACYLTSLFDDTFFCGKDVAVQWSQEEGACSVFYAKEPFILNFTLGLACYLAIYAVSLTMLARGILKASTSTTVAFAIGALAVSSGTIRFICLKVGTGQGNLVYILSMVEMTLSIIVACLPGLKPLLRSSRANRRDSSATEVEVEHPKSSFS